MQEQAVYEMVCRMLRERWGGATRPQLTLVGGTQFKNASAEVRSKPDAWGRARPMELIRAAGRSG
jgi:hypothetical protein